MKTGNLIRIGISSCLLGENVRYNAGHKRDDFIVETLGRRFTWVPVCPEVEMGLGTPRESMGLVKSGKTWRMVTSQTGVDLTDRMNRFASMRVRALVKLNLHGYLFKKNSPSCGVFANPMKGTGLFAAELMRALPNLPVEEEGRLRNLDFRENWIERVFAYHRLQRLWQDFSVGKLVQFHTEHKIALLAHSEVAYRRMGRLVAGAKAAGKARVREEYERELMETLKIEATRKKNRNVLEHLAGYFKKNLDPESKKELSEVIRSYHSEQVPLVVPLVLIRHYVRTFKVEYLRTQTYLNRELIT